MLTGLPPFYDTNVQRMYHKILHEPLRFPKSDGLLITIFNLLFISVFYHIKKILFYYFILLLITIF
jgi:hypothetical protein